MTFEVFITQLSARLGPDTVDEGEVTPETTLVSLELDSLQHVELWVLCEELGLDLPEELFESLDTLGDLFYYVETKTGHRI